MLDTKLKGHMIQEQLRSRLMYGNCHLGPNKIDELETFENNVLKEYLKVPRNSFSTPLLDTVRVRPLREAIAIRKYSFLSQLTSNALTNKIIFSDLEHDYKTLITSSGYSGENAENETIEYRSQTITNKCQDSIRRVRKNRDWTKLDDRILNATPNTKQRQIATLYDQLKSERTRFGLEGN